MEAMFGSPLPLDVCSRAHVLFMLFAGVRHDLTMINMGLSYKKPDLLTFCGIHSGRVRVAYLCSLLCCAVYCVPNVSSIS